MDEHRVTTRRRTVKEGKVILTKWTVMDCLVRDLSHTGALLEFATPTKLPAEFRLRILVMGAEAPVELVWQRGLKAGVRFETPLR